MYFKKFEEDDLEYYKNLSSFEKARLINELSTLGISIISTRSDKEKVLNYQEPPHPSLIQLLQKLRKDAKER